MRSASPSPGRRCRRHGRPRSRASAPARRTTACTHVVVTPNMVRPIAGRDCAASSVRAKRIMPASACAALPSRRREMRLSPWTSVTDGTSHRSAGADIGRDVAGRDGGDQDFRHADRQRAHCRREQRGAATAARADHAGDVIAADDEAFECHDHRRDRRAAVSQPEHGGFAIRMMPRHLRRADVAMRAMRSRRYIDRAGTSTPSSRRHVAMKPSSGPLVSNVPQT